MARLGGGLHALGSVRAVPHPSFVIWHLSFVILALFLSLLSNRPPTFSLNSGASSPARTISLFTATCIVIANMVGTGVFTSLGFQVHDLPTGFSIVALWLVGGFCALCGALAYGELATALPRSGGEYHFLSVIYHPAAGFLAGWISITVGFAAPVALVAMAFGSYFHGVFAWAAPLPISLIVVIAVASVHLFGTRAGSRFQDGATILKLVLILVLIAAGAFCVHSQPVSFLPTAADPALLKSAGFAVSLVYVMYAYSGWNATAYIVNEVRDPGRTIPLSVLIGTAIVMVLYVGLNAIFLLVAPMQEMALKQEVALVAATHIFGPAGGRITAGLICAGLVASVSAMVWIGPRVTVAMGEDWQILRLLSRRTSRGIPALAILTQTAITCVLLVAGNFQTVLTYIQFSLTICSFLTVLGVYILRYRQPDLARPCKMWGYPVTPFIFLAVNLWMMGFLLKTQWKESLAGLATCAVGLLVYWLCPNRLAGEEKARRPEAEA
jgi:APA family basic amino acid/polyamine antiporter